MARRRLTQLRRAAKWVGLVLCVLIAAAWVLSHFWYAMRLDHHAGPRLMSLIVSRGTVKATLALDPAADWQRDYEGSWFDLTGWYIWSQARHHLPARWWPGFETWTAPSGVAYHTMIVPMWIPFLLVGVPTAWLWWRDRRARPGHCAACGYDLAGLAAGAQCPECGDANRDHRGSEGAVP